MGIPLRQGRLFDERDTAPLARAVIVNETLVRRHFPGEDPLGKQVVEAGESWEIVGVVGDVRLRTLGEDFRPLLYEPHTIYPWSSGHFFIRTTVAPLALAESVRKAIRDVDPDQPVTDVRTLDDVIAASVAQRRLVLTLLAAFADSALLLAAVGLYGVIAYAVSQRTQETGVRMTLGAERRDVIALVLREGLKLTGLGLLLGLVGALGLSRVLGDFLYEVKPSDPTTFAGVSAVLLLVALLASWLPARRAASVDPMQALR